MIPFGITGTSVLDWSYGSLHKFYEHVLIQIKSKGISPNVFLWHQGEKDIKVSSRKMNDYNKTPLFKRPWIIFGLNANIYSEYLQVIFEKSQNIFPNSKFGIALVSSCFENQWEPIRNAQYKITMKNKMLLFLLIAIKFKAKNIDLMDVIFHLKVQKF